MFSFFLALFFLYFFKEILCKLAYTIKYDLSLSHHLNSDNFLSLSRHLNSDNDHNLLSPILPNFLQTIPRLNYLKIDGSRLDWNKLNSSLTSVFLHLMHLPTITRIDLSYISNFPLPRLSLSDPCMPCGHSYEQPYVNVMVCVTVCQIHACPPTTANHWQFWSNWQYQLWRRPHGVFFPNNYSYLILLPLNNNDGHLISGRMMVQAESPRSQMAR